MTVKRRGLWIGVIVLGVLVVLSLVFAPQSADRYHQGSTYSRAPGGYGAWYAYMQEQGVDIQRWEKPLEDLIQPSQLEQDLDQETVPIQYERGIWGEKNDPKVSLTLAQSALSQADLAQTQAPPPSPITLLQIDNGQGWLDLPSAEWLADWLGQGNVLIQLGVGFSTPSRLGVLAPVTNAPFTSEFASSVGEVKIQTSRRFVASLDPSSEQTWDEQNVRLLSDGYGTAVLGRTVGNGRLVSAITANLAANAYQDEPGNFQFLAQLVTEAGNPIFVDEYFHGYKDADVIVEETSESLLNYLAKTPIALVALQAAVILLVLIWGLNRRLGPPTALAAPKVDNSTAYIQALAAVLQKANCSEFVVATVGKAEQLHVQRSLGLGTDMLPPETVVDAWVQQTGRSPTDLEEMLRTAAQPRRLSEHEVLVWLGKIQAVRRQLE